MITLEGKTVLVSGATGLAGSGVIRHLLANYPEVQIRALHNSTPPFIINPRIDYVQVDLTIPAAVRESIRGVDIAVMAAAHTGGAGSAISEPHQAVTQNMVMDSVMLENLYHENVKRLIFISSATVYQEFDGFIKEDQLDLNSDPHESYFGVGWAKRASEKLCEFWHKKFGQQIVIVRAANIFGPWSSFDPRRSNFIPALIRKAVARMDPFEIWGNRTVTRDVIFVNDFAEATVALLVRNDINFGVFNLGSEIKTSVGDVADWVLKHAGHKPRKVKCLEEKPTMIDFRGLDCQKIRETIDWEPKISIEEGVRCTIDWWRKNRTWWGN